MIAGGWGCRKLVRMPGTVSAFLLCENRKTKEGRNGVQRTLIHPEALHDELTISCGGFASAWIEEVENGIHLV